MPQKLVWTGPRDLQIKRMRADRASWDAIALSLGISRNAAIERGRKIGARLPPPEFAPAMEDPDRPALPPGHPTTWGLITAGTLLAGEAYIPPCAWPKGSGTIRTKHEQLA
jgi:hypothetical protein